MSVQREYWRILGKILAKVHINFNWSRIFPHNNKRITIFSIFVCLHSYCLTGGIIKYKNVIILSSIFSLLNGKRVFCYLFGFVSLNKFSVHVKLWNNEMSIEFRAGSIFYQLRVLLCWLMIALTLNWLNKIKQDWKECLLR